MINGKKKNPIKSIALLEINDLAGSVKGGKLNSRRIHICYGQNFIS